jgi:hypothetical protein
MQRTDDVQIVVRRDPLLYAKRKIKVPSAEFRVLS